MAEVQLIIMGRTRAGKPFRPSDWAERLCSQTATFCNKSKLTRLVAERSRLAA
jgi:hypothetical protein